MGKRIRSRLTFANVVAMLALFIALGGSVYAAGKINGKTIKRNSLPGNRLKADSVTGQQVNEGSLGVVPNATNATSAVNATNAASAQPVAFAHVNDDGTLDPANSKNISGVVRQAEGIYCVSGLPFTPRGGQVTVDAFGSASQYGQVATEGCDENSDATVDTFNPLTGDFQDAPFFVVFYG
jgi:hypothetical protein